MGVDDEGEWEWKSANDERVKKQDDSIDLWMTAETELNTNTHSHTCVWHLSKA